jgi:hypothetical protein
MDVEIAFEGLVSVKARDGNLGTVLGLVVMVILMNIIIGKLGVSHHRGSQHQECKKSFHH